MPWYKTETGYALIILGLFVGVITIIITFDEPEYGFHEIAIYTSDGEELISNGTFDDFRRVKGKSEFTIDEIINMVVAKGLTIDEIDKDSEYAGIAIYVHQSYDEIS